MIEINGITKHFGKKEVLHDISLHLDNSIYGLLGPNGAGKTTLLRILSGIYDQHGQNSIHHLGLRVGYLPQKFGCFPNLTVFEQLQFFCCIKKLSENKQKTEIHRVMELTNLLELSKVKCRKLSGGMVRRVGIAQAILGKPDLLLLDEPTVGLDLEERRQFIHIIRNFDTEMPILLSTHIAEDITALCDKLLIMKSGRIIQTCNMNDFLATNDDITQFYLNCIKDEQ
jgi:ABC-2 type transport system ATP-binding protein